MQTGAVRYGALSMNESKQDTPFFNWSRRKNLRVEVHTKLVLDSPIGKMDSTLQDLSIGGMFVTCDKPLPVGSHCGTNLRVKSDGTIHNLRLDGEVVHQRDGGMGISFRSLPKDTEEVIQMIVNLVVAQAPIER